MIKILRYETLSYVVQCQSYITILQLVNVDQLCRSDDELSGEKNDSSAVKEFRREDAFSRFVTMSACM